MDSYTLRYLSNSGMATASASIFVRPFLNERALAFQTSCQVTHRQPAPCSAGPVWILSLFSLVSCGIKDGSDISLLFEIRMSWVLFPLRFHLSPIVQDPSSSVGPPQRSLAHTTLLNRGIEAVTLVLPRALPESGSEQDDDQAKTNPFQAVHACIVGLAVEAIVRRINVLERPLDDFVTIYFPLSNSSVLSFGMIGHA
jgi:hypothetical protein